MAGTKYKLKSTLKSQKIKNATKSSRLQIAQKAEIQKICFGEI